MSKWSKHYLSVCAIFRNEGPYLREWIEFHRLQGVDHFYLYDNLSTDDGPEILAPYVETGIVTLRSWGHQPGQLVAYFDAVVRLKQSRETRWCAFLDIDEFLYSTTGQPISVMLPAYAEAPAVGVNWSVFGTSGHVHKPLGLVTESYTRRAPLEHPLNEHIKSIVRPEMCALRRPADPHHFPYVAGFACNEWHEPIHGPFSRPPSHELMRINHYWSKSEDEAIAKAGKHRSDNGELRSVEQLLDPTLNAEEDRTILRWFSQLEKAYVKSLHEEAA
jgi:hypothetical protein